MYVYSFTPLPVPSEGHTGLVIWIILALVTIGWMINDDDGLVRLFRPVLLICIGFFTVLVATESFKKQPENIETVGTFVGFQPEGYREQTRKTKSNVHYLYVVYKLPNGNTIMLAGIPGGEYPKHAVLYGNKR